MSKGWIGKCRYCDYKTSSKQRKALEIVHQRIFEHIHLMHNETIIEVAENSCDYEEINY